MPRTKLTIRRLETVQARQSKYSKRKVGLLKKAKELSVLCEIDLALLMFSPTGKPSLFVGHNKYFLLFFFKFFINPSAILAYCCIFHCRDLSNVVEKMSKLSVEDREQR